MKRLILGGVKSGKSHYAEQCAKQWLARSAGAENAVVYVATAEVREDDEGFAARIARHQVQRPTGWRTIEEALNIDAIISAASNRQQCVLVECLTLWMSNVLCKEALSEEARLSQRIDDLCAVIEAYDGELILVSNETGLGIMPPNALARRFGDEMGMLHQRLAALCDEVVLTVAGLPHFLKQVEY